MNLPEFQSFLTPSRQSDLFETLKWVLFFVAPLVMIWAALESIGHLIQLIRGMFGKAKGEKNDDDDDYDVYRY
jgi:hypothetical protein